jgi:CHAT domain-containing protein/tetratricopeptide (TPR) repeat protein
MAYQQCGRYEEAEKFFIEGIDIIRNIAGTDNFEYANSAINLGDLYREIGLNYKSVQLTDEARKILFKIGKTDTDEFAAATNNLANCEHLLGNYIKAEILYDTALIYIERLAKKNPLAAFQGKFTIYSNRGALASQTADYDKAVFWLRKSFDLARNSYPKISLKYNIVLSNYASALTNLVQYDTAKAYLYSIIANLEKGKLQTHPIYLGAKSNLADIFRLQGKNDSAINVLNEIITISQKAGRTTGREYLYSLANLCQNYLAMDSLQKAGAVNNQLLPLIETDNQEADIQLLSNIAMNAAMYNIKMEKYDEAFANIKNNFTRIDLIFKTNFIFLAEQEKLGLVTLANENLQLAFAATAGMVTIPDSVKAWLFSKLISYRSVLLDETSLFYRQIKRSAEGESRNLYNEWLANKSFLNNYYKSPDEKLRLLVDSVQVATDKLEVQLAQLVNYSKEKTAALNAEWISKFLDPGELFVEYVRYPVYTKETKQFNYHYAAFILSGKSDVPAWKYMASEETFNKILRTSGEKALDKQQINKIFTAVKDPVKKTFSNPLYQIAWNGILNEKEWPKKVYCIPDGVLAQLPLHILPDSLGEPLMNKVSVNFILSPGSLKKDQGQLHTNDKLSIWGGFNYNGTPATERTALNKLNSYPEIRWSITEAENIALLAKERNVSYRVFKKEQGSKTNFINPENSSKDIVHISTHSLFRPAALFLDHRNQRQLSSPFARNNNPLLNCGLIFSGVNATDSLYRDTCLLTGYSISHTDFSKTKLVVLSACETGLGSLVGSEGAFGLQRAFRLAGAEKIMVSLWQVPDKQTSELMILFYKNLFAGKDPAQSLQKAQQEMRKKYAAYPYYWAGFVLVE